MRVSTVKILYVGNLHEINYKGFYASCAYSSHNASLNGVVLFFKDLLIASDVDPKQIIKEFLGITARSAIIKERNSCSMLILIDKHAYMEYVKKYSNDKKHYLNSEHCTKIFENVFLSKMYEIHHLSIEHIFDSNFSLTNAMNTMFLDDLIFVMKSL